MTGFYGEAFAPKLILIILMLHLVCHREIGLFAIQKMFSFMNAEILLLLSISVTRPRTMIDVNV